MAAVASTISSTRWGNKALSLFLALVILFTVLPAQRVYAAETFTCRLYHTVSANDTLNKIAKNYSVKFSDLVAANKLKEPYTIFVGQKLCIPKASKNGAQGADKDAGAIKAHSFTVTHTKDGFVLRGLDFLKKSTYLVKVDDASTPEVVWVKLNKFKTGDKTSFTLRFQLPKELRNATYLNICLKNQITDQLVCKFSIRYIP